MVLIHILEGRRAETSASVTNEQFRGLCIDSHPKPLEYQFHSRQSKSRHLAVSFSLGFGDRPFENFPMQNFAAMCVEERLNPAFNIIHLWKKGSNE
jgi:hypothetical protein